MITQENEQIGDDDVVAEIGRVIILGANICNINERSEQAGVDRSLISIICHTKVQRELYSLRFHYVERSSEVEGKPVLTLKMDSDDDTLRLIDDCQERGIAWQDVEMVIKEKAQIESKWLRYMMQHYGKDVRVGENATSTVFEKSG